MGIQSVRELLLGVAITETENESFSSQFCCLAIFSGPWYLMFPPVFGTALIVSITYHSTPSVPHLGRMPDQNHGEHPITDVNKPHGNNKIEQRLHLIVRFYLILLGVLFLYKSIASLNTTPQTQREVPHLPG